MNYSEKLRSPLWQKRRLEVFNRDNFTCTLCGDADIPGSIAPTCVAHYAKDLGTRLVKDRKSKHGLRPFTIREYARLQGFPDDFKFKNERNSYKLIGNAVPKHLGEWCGQQAMKYFN